MFRSEEVRPQYKLLKPVTSSPRSFRIYERSLTFQEWDRYILTPCRRSKIVALDFETTGLDPLEDRLVGVGLSWSTASCYVDLTVQGVDTMSKVWTALAKLPLIGHNVMFDGRWLDQKVDSANWRGDTYGAFKHLASEGFDGQSWGLKDAQVNLLGWDAKGDVELDEWLVDAGYVKGTSKKADKGEMWRAPAHILGKYCALDADSTYQLWTLIFEPVFRKFPNYLRYHQEEYLTLLQLLIKQQNRGILLDMPHILEYSKELDADQIKYRAEFLEHEDVARYIKEFRLDAVRKIWDRKKPEVWKKNGDISKNYLKWVEKVCKVWRETSINLDSSVQIRKLFYENLFSYTRHEDWRGRASFEIKKGNQTVTLEGTQSGLPPTDAGALKWLGEPGRILSKYKDVVKQKSFVDKYLELRDSSSRLHPGWRVPGTLTGRLSGAEPNLQQLSKTEKMLKCFIPQPGYTLVGADFASLENVVLAELSRDPNLLKLYGPTAKANDGYLFFGSMLPIIGPKIRAAGYDPDEPTKEGIAQAKKEAKKERSIAKVLVLSDQYGAGAEKKWKTLRNQGVHLTLDEVKEMHRKQKELLKGLEKYRETLQTEWERRRGYIVTGYGRPAPVWDKLTKDLVNRDGQSTGHDCTMRWIWHTKNLLEKSKVEAYPFIVDFHDESIWEVKQGQEEEMVSILQEACRLLNSELSAAGWICNLKIDPALGHDLSQIKMD